MKRKSSESDPEKPTTSGVTGIPNQTNSSATASMAHEKSQKRMGKRPGRKPSKIDQKAKLERSRQSARECRARKKLRYQYLEELVSSREKAVFSLRDEVEMYKRWSVDLDRGIIPDGLLKLLAQEEMQAPLPIHRSPTSQSSSTPTVSPSSSADTEYMAAVPGGQLGRQISGLSGQQTQRSGQPMQQQQQQSRRQPLTRQPNVGESGQPLSSLSKGSRSFEESPRSSSAASSMIYRSESVPNLAVASVQHGVFPEPASSTTLVYKDFNETSTSNLQSTGFLPELTTLNKVICDTDTASNIPTVVTHHSPPSVTSKAGAAWTWESQPCRGARSSQGRTYPFATITSASSAVPTTQSAHLTSPAFRGELLSSASPLSPPPNFLMSSQSSVSAGNVPSSTVPFYQRPRSSSDLAKKVTSTTLSPATSSLSLSQQNLSGVLEPAVTSFGSHDVFPTMAGSVTTCLTNSTILHDTAPVCMGSELSASISEPIPHWYSFLDDLESVASLSARQGAFSDAGTPGSSRARSGAGTPSSVDSPYSQQLLQQQQHLQQPQQQQDSGSDGNIPHIISDLLDQSPSS